MATEDKNKKDNKKTALNLSNLKAAKGSTKTKKRLGRGIGSGTGKTSGRGHKGQQSRSGASIPDWFEGGSMPLYRRVPKYGFRSRKQMFGVNQYNVVSLAVINKNFADGDTIDLESLQAKGFATKAKLKAGVKILAHGEVDKKFTLKVNAISAAALSKIEAAGGTCEIVK